jgi:uncharacterized Zn finger protein
MAWDDYDDRPWYPPSRPRAAKGGIRAQSQRGAFAEHWWAKRWIGVLESFDIGARLQRGRSYARRGQVTSLELSPGLVEAQVQGSRPRPYAVSVKIRQLTPGEWRNAIDVIAGRAAYAARLLAGEMPQDIEQAFAAAGVALFPERSRELATACSCPDWSNPCKHVAAVYYLVGEEFDRDPFLLFRLRGLDRQQLMVRLGGGVPSPPAAPDSRRKPSSRRAARQPARPPAESPTDAEPTTDRGALSADPARFWHSPPLAGDFFGAVEVPATEAALVRRLGRFPFWRGERGILECLEPMYARAARNGLDAFVTVPDEGGTEG